MAHTERRTSVFWLANEGAKVGGEMGGKIGWYCQKNIRAEDTDIL